MQLKSCTICKSEKPLEKFARDNRARGGRPPRNGHGVTAWCKTCTAERRKPGIHQERRAAAELAAQGLKRCSSCKQVKSTAEFHIRRASNDGRAYRCPDCVKAFSKKWRQANPDAFSIWHAENREHRSQTHRQWRERNIEQRKKAYAEWAKANPHKVNALIAKRNAIKRHALAPWADQNAIRAIYAEASRLTRETGIRHEVDHIYPLQGEICCGLHVENNLQILTKVENIRKKNRMPEEYEAMVRERKAA